MANKIFSNASFLDCPAPRGVLEDDDVNAVAAVTAGSGFIPSFNPFAGGVFTVPGDCWTCVGRAAIDVGIAATTKGDAAAIGRVFGAIAVGFGDAAIVDVTGSADRPIVLSANCPPKTPGDVKAVAAPGSDFIAPSVLYKFKK